MGNFFCTPDDDQLFVLVDRVKVLEKRLDQQTQKTDEIIGLLYDLKDDRVSSWDLASLRKT